MVKVGYKSYVGFETEASFGTFVNPAKYIEYLTQNQSVVNRLGAHNETNHLRYL